MNYLILRFSGGKYFQEIWNSVKSFGWLKVFFVFGLFSYLTISPALADDLDSALGQLGAQSRKQIKAAIVQLGNSGGSKALMVLEAMKEKRLRIDADGVLVILDESEEAGVEALTGNPVDPDSLDLRKPRVNNAIRRVLSVAIGKLKLKSQDADTRVKAAEELLKRPSESVLELVNEVLKQEQDERVRNLLSLILAKGHLESDDPEKRLQAVLSIGEYGDFRFIPDLQSLLTKDEEGRFVEKDSKVRKAATIALGSLERRQFLINQIANLFYGLSLGSILLLAALGLAITFGLMGVINMAHGEMIMLGAYSTYVVQGLFESYLSGFWEWYLLAAIPTAFLVSALVGILLERSIIRHLYGRPLETLLATWGISLLLIQTVRLTFGAQNVEVTNPSWLSGGIKVFEGVVFPYNRITIIVFVIFVVTLVWALLQKTTLGLQVRAVTQNREMASCVGISTSKIDMLTFGLGSGIAGLGGVVLSQIGNVGPELGQSYIVDCFMVVVLGGVGKIAGTIVGALGLGIINKFLEPVAGAVLGKIIVLVLIILVIQKRPQGLFALKGRSVD